MFHCERSVVDVYLLHSWHYLIHSSWRTDDTKKWLLLFVRSPLNYEQSDFYSGTWADAKREINIKMGCNGIRFWPFRRTPPQIDEKSNTSSKVNFPVFASSSLICSTTSVKQGNALLFGWFPSSFRALNQKVEQWQYGTIWIQSRHDQPLLEWSINSSTTG